MKYKVKKKEFELNTCGTECPIPVLRARKLSQNLKHGDIVKVLATDPLAEQDFRYYCEESKFDYLGCKKEGKKFIIKYMYIAYD
tara:strand:+ start:546 stop:797 length:252 start_codon:yes stop_codon:yes gene_type:complete